MASKKTARKSASKGGPPPKAAPSKAKGKSKRSNGAAGRAESRRSPAEALKFADQELVEWMQKHPKEFLEQRHRALTMLNKRRCAYGRSGGALPITIAPMILTRPALEKLTRVSEVLDRALDKVIQAWVTDEYVKSQFPYPDIPPEWMRWDPGYPKPTVISRHDAIFDGKTLKFIEFNTDNPGARAWVDTYEEVYREIPMYEDLLERHAVNTERRQMRTIYEIFRDYWKQWGSGGTPRVALSTFKEYLPGSEWETLRDYLIEHGMEANLVDSREFEYRNGKLYSGRVKFDILHLCLRFVFFKRFPREHEDFFAAIRDRACMTINHFRGAIGSQKEVMSFMTNPENHRYFDAEEVAAIEEHVPWTRRMDETITLCPEGRDVTIVDYALKNREKLVLKITTGAGGQDVYVGRSTEQSKWADAIEWASGCSWWILQEAVEIPEYEIPVLDGKKVVLAKKSVNVNPYVFDGKYVGSVARVSDSKVINVAAGGGVMPVFEQR